MTYCELSETPAFQFLVTDLTPALGDRANFEAFKDYLEYGRLREKDEILGKISGDYFSPLSEKEIERRADEEINMTQKAKLQAIGMKGVPKKEISYQQILNLKQMISTHNNDLFKSDVDRVFKLDFKQVGESDNYTWDIKVYRGKLNAQAKAQRNSDTVLDANRLPNPGQQANLDLKDLQTSIRTALLGASSDTNGNQNSGSGASGINSKVLGNSIGRKLSDPKEFPHGTLQRSGEGLAFHGSRGLITDSNVEKFSGKSFQDIFSGSSYSGRERALYSVCRLFESFHSNSLNRAILQQLQREMEASDEKFNITSTHDDNVAYLFANKNGIVINVAKIMDEFNLMYNTGVNLDQFVNMAAFEELIHVVAITKLSETDYTAAMQELTPDILNDISQYYRSGKKIIGAPTLNDRLILSHEYFRALVQNEFLGETTETVRFVKSGSFLKDLVETLWNFLKDIFQNNKLPNSRVVVDQITQYINQAQSDQNGFVAYQNDFGEITNYAQDIVRKYADVLAEQFGVDYSFVTPDEARQITENADNPWTGQKAFFFNGQVHFIEGALTPDDVLHEFAHPLLRSIALQNRPLFTSLYDKLLLTDEGKGIVEDAKVLYPNLTENADDFKEEVLVRALAKKQDLNNRGLESTSAFEKFVNDLLYAIKQLLRKTFGSKIPVSNLDVNTTLDELSKMLAEGTAFKLDPEVITDRDFVAYKTEFNEFVKKFNVKSANAQEMEKLVNSYFNQVKKHIANLRNKKDLGALAEVMVNDFKSGELQQMQQNLKPYQTKILENSIQLEDDVELTRQRAVAVINSLSNVENMVGTMLKGLPEILTNIDDPANVQKALYFQKVLNYWGNFVNEARISLENNGAPRLTMVDNITADIKRANNMLDTFYEKSSRQILWDTLKGTAETIDNRWQEHIADLKARKQPAEVIKRAEEDWKNERFTEEMIDGALKGTIKDVSTLGTFLEGYGFSPDPVVGGIALYMKNNMTHMQAVVQRNFNDASKVIKPLLDKAGLNNMNQSWKVGEKVGQVEEVGHVNEKGEFEKKKVWRYMHEFTGADIVQDKFRYDIKKAGEKYEQSHSQEDKTALANLQAEWSNHYRDYWHQEYTEPFYQAYDVLKNDDLGNEVRMDLDRLYTELGQLTGQLNLSSVEDLLDLSDEIEMKRREIKQLASLYDEAGELKTGRDLEKAMRLKEFNEGIKNLYDQVEVDGAFQSAYRAFEQKLMDEGKKQDSPEYRDQLDRWVSKNTRKAVLDAFWDKITSLMEERKKILQHLVHEELIDLEVEKHYETLRSLVRGNRDESGQPMGNEMTPEKQEKIRDIMKAIDAAQEKLVRMSGLTKAENDWIDKLFAKMGNPMAKMTTQDQIRLSQLMNKRNALRLSKVKQARLRGIQAELNELRSKEATDDYIDQVNNLLAGMDGAVVTDILNKLSIDKTDAGLLSSDRIVQDLMDHSEDFKEWFLRNHISREDVDWETKENKKTWQRTYAWNVITPADDRYYHHTTVTNLAGEQITLKALPSLKFFKRLVKDEFKTKKIEGQTVDNRGYFLPKTMAQGAKDDRYQNKAYERMKREDPNTFNLLEALKHFHLKSQEGLESKAKLWMDFARYRKDNAENLRTGNLLQRFLDRIRTLWKKMGDRWDRGFNYDDTANLIKLDLFEDETSGLPISGLSNLEFEDTSTDVLVTSMRYMASAEKNKTLASVSPVLRAIQRVVNNEKNSPLETKMMTNATLLNLNKKKSKYVRARAVNNYVERVLEGKENTGWLSDNAVANNIQKALFKFSAGTYLNLNIPSALKNSIGQKFQAAIEAAGGKYMSTRDLIAAEGWATATTFQISSDIYKQGPKSLNVQLVELFDPERDRFMQHVGESMVKTVGKDYFFHPLKRLTDFRRITQLQSSLQTFGAMMKHQLVEQDGRKIPYLEAWELRDGLIQLKPGVDPSWGITYKDGKQLIGKNYLRKQGEFQRVLEYLNGAMSREESPEADRYLLGRFFTFFRRFMVSMVVNRFGYSGSLFGGTSRGRLDFHLGTSKEGWYITVLKLAMDTVRRGGKNLPYMKAEEKTVFIRFMSEMGMLAIIQLLFLPLLGWDPDDKDRFKKLRAKSGALPVFGVKDDPSRPFEWGGFLENHALLLNMQIFSENSFFIPVPGLGLNDWKQMTELQSLAFGPTTTTMYQMLKDLGYIATGDERAYYKRTVGPLETQQEGSLKLWNHIASAYALKGSHIDPVVGIKNFQMIEGR